MSYKSIDALQKTLTRDIFSYAKSPNKELKVLAQSYDWLLFFTDVGLSKFISALLLNPKKKYKSVQSAFIDSYSNKKTGNRFTKVKISLSADQAIQEYFKENLLEKETDGENNRK